MIYQSIKNILTKLGITHDEIEHPESISCEDSKKFRQEAGLNGIGSKNIVFHAKGEYYLVTTLGDKDIKARKFKKEFGTKDIRFATQEEITQILGATIGSIPPFGFLNENIKVFVDMEIFEYEYFMFNPGVGTKSIRVKKEDLFLIYKNLKNEVKTFDFTSEEVIFSLLEK